MIENHSFSYIYTQIVLSILFKRYESCGEDHRIDDGRYRASRSEFGVLGVAGEGNFVGRRYEGG